MRNSLQSSVGEAAEDETIRNLLLLHLEQCQLDDDVDDGENRRKNHKQGVPPHFWKEQRGMKKLGGNKMYEGKAVSKTLLYTRDVGAVLYIFR